MDNTTILYNAIQRVYRNSIIELVRSTFESSNAKGIEDIRRLFAKKQLSGKTQWEEMKSTAEERRCGGTGEISTPVRDEYELIGVEHFYNIFEAHFELL